MSPSVESDYTQLAPRKDFLLFGVPFFQLIIYRGNCSILIDPSLSISALSTLIFEMASGCGFVILRSFPIAQTLVELMEYNVHTLTDFESFFLAGEVALQGPVDSVPSVWELRMPSSLWTLSSSSLPSLDTSSNVSMSISTLR